MAKRKHDRDRENKKSGFQSRFQPKHSSRFGSFTGEDLAAEYAAWMNQKQNEFQNFVNDPLGIQDDVTKGRKFVNDKIKQGKNILDSPSKYAQQKIAAGKEKLNSRFKDSKKILDSLKNPAIISRIKEFIGRGRMLPEKIQQEFESEFGDLSDVRIHTDEKAVQLCRELNAKAFAYGTDIFFNEGAYDPSSEEGRELLAHELAHVVEQSVSGEEEVERQVEEDSPVFTEEVKKEKEEARSYFEKQPEKIKEEQHSAQTETSDDYGKDVQWDIPLSQEQKERYNWENILTRFREENKPITDAEAAKWARKSISEGWREADSVPDIHLAGFKAEGDVLLVSAYSFDEAYAAVGEISYPGYWYWISPFDGRKLSGIQLYDSVNIYNREYYTFSIALLDALQKVAQDNTLYQKALSSGKIDKEFSELVKEVQRKIWNTDDPKLVTGMLDEQTKERVIQKTEADKAEEKRKYLTAGQEITMGLVGSNLDLYGSYQNAGGMGSFEPEKRKDYPLVNLPKLISILNDVRFKDWTLSKFEQEYTYGYRESPEYRLLSNRKNWHLFSLIYNLRESAYGNSVNHQIRSEDEFYTALSLYEDHLYKGNDSFRNGFTRYLQTRVNELISQNENILIDEMAKYGIVEGDFTKAGPSLEQIKSELYSQYENVRKIKESEAIQKKYEYEEDDNALPQEYYDSIRQDAQATAQLQKKYKELQGKYPILRSRELDPDTTAGLKKIEALVLSSQSEETLIRNLNIYFLARKNEIVTLRKKLQEKPSRYWQLEKAVALVKTELGVDENITQNFIVRDFEKEDTREINNLWDSILRIGLGVVTFFVPEIAPVTVPYLAYKGTEDLSKSLDEYSFRTAASGGTFDKDMSLSAVEPTMMFVALDIIGIGLDVIDLGQALKLFARQSKLFNTASKTIDKEGYDVYVNKVKSYADEKGLKEAEKETLFKGATDKVKLENTYKAVLEGRMNTSEVFDTYSKNTGSVKGQPLKASAEDLRTARGIAELDAEIKTLNKKFSDLKTKQYGNLLEEGVLYSSLIPPQLINELYKAGRKLYDILSVGGQLTYAKFRYHMRRGFSNLDFSSPDMDELLRKMYEDVAMNGISEERRAIIREFREAHPESILTNKELDEMLEKGHVWNKEEKVLEKSELFSKSTSYEIEPIYQDFGSNKAIIWKLKAGDQVYENKAIIFGDTVTFDFNTLGVKGLGKQFLDETFEKYGAIIKKIDVSWNKRSDYPDAMAKGLREFWDYMDKNPGANYKQAIQNTGLYKLVKEREFTSIIIEEVAKDRTKVSFYLSKK